MAKTDANGGCGILRSIRRFTTQSARAGRIGASMLSLVVFVALLNPAQAQEPSSPMRLAQFPFNLFGGDGGDSRSGSSSSQAPRPITVNIQAGRDINPGPNGGAAPVSVQVFMLRSTGRFQSLDYFQLRDANSLGADLVDRQTVSVTPGGSASVSLNSPGAGQAGYVGVVAGFRKIDEAHWRASATVESGSSVQVSVSRLSVSVTALSGRQ